MKKIVALLSVFVCTLSIALAPQLAQAQFPAAPAGNTNTSTTTKNDFGLSKTKDVQLPSQAPGVFIGNIIRWVLGLLGVLLIAMIVYGGITYATAAGNDERAGTAKKIITYAIIGTVIVVAAAIISQFVLNTLFADPETGSATGITSSNASSSSARLPNQNPQRGLASICNPQSTACEGGLTCLKDPSSAQYACLKKKGSTCNTNTQTAIGINGCQFGTKCVKKSNPVNSQGFPDGSLDNGRCE